MKDQNATVQNSVVNSPYASAIGGGTIPLLKEPPQPQREKKKSINLWTIDQPSVNPGSGSYWLTVSVIHIITICSDAVKQHEHISCASPLRVSADKSPQASAESFGRVPGKPRSMNPNSAIVSAESSTLCLAFWSYAWHDRQFSPEKDESTRMDLIREKCFEIKSLSCLSKHYWVFRWTLMSVHANTILCHYFCAVDSTFCFLSHTILC